MEDQTETLLRQAVENARQACEEYGWDSGICCRNAGRLEDAQVALLEYRIARLRLAANDLYVRVQMDESVGLCLSERGSTLALGEVLALEMPREGQR